MYDQTNYNLHTPDIDSKSLTYINIKHIMLIHTKIYFGLGVLYQTNIR